MFFGDELKKNREEKGISIEEIAEETKIQKRYLIDIEKGELENLPGKTYVRGFLKNYSLALKIDPVGILEKYDEYYNLKEQKEKVVDEIQEGKVVGKKKAKGVRKKNIIFAFLGLFVFYIIILVITPIFEAPEENNKIITEKTQREVQKKLQKKIPEKEKKKIQEEKKNILEKEIQIMALDRSWLEIKEEKEIVFLGYIQKGEIKNIKTEKKVYLKIGDASNIKIKYNGKDLGILGKAKELIKKEF